MDFDLSSEQEQLRDAVRALGKRYGHQYFVSKAKAGEHSDELWDEAAKLVGVFTRLGLAHEVLMAVALAEDRKSVV